MSILTKNFHFISLLVFLILSTLLFADDPESNSQIKGAVETDAESLKSILGENEFVLVQFYAEWCPHCRKFAPIYEQVAQELDIPVLRVNAEQNSEAAQKAGITGFPTVVLYRNQEPWMTYNSRREKESLVAWTNALTGDVVLRFSVESELILPTHVDSVIISVDEDHCKEIGEHMLSGSLLTTRVIHVDPANLAALGEQLVLSTKDIESLLNSGVSSDKISLVVLAKDPVLGDVGQAQLHIRERFDLSSGKSGSGEAKDVKDSDSDDSNTKSTEEYNPDAEKPVFDDNWNWNNYVSWIISTMNGLVHRIDYQNSFLDAGRLGKATMILFLDSDFNDPSIKSLQDGIFSQEQQETLLNLVNHPEIKDRLSILYIPVKTYPSYFEASMGSDAPLPSFGLMLWDNSDDQPIPSQVFYSHKYFTGDLWNEFDKVTQVLVDILNGDLEWIPKSMPIEPQPEGDPVLKVVADNFNQLVGHSRKHVFLKVFTEECPHCTELAPVWTELAQTLSGVDSLVIAEIEGQKNDLPNSVVAAFGGFPTLILYSRFIDEDGLLKTNVIPYPGGAERTHDAFITFLYDQLGDIQELQSFENYQPPSTDSGESTDSPNGDDNNDNAETDDIIVDKETQESPENENEPAKVSENSTGSETDVETDSRPDQNQNTENSDEDQVHDLL